MPVTSQDKGRGDSDNRSDKMSRNARAQNRSAPAKALTDSRYRQRVVKSAKVYSRKGEKKPEAGNDGE